MKEREHRRVCTISAKTFDEFDSLYNETADRLAKFDPEVRDIDALSARFYYTETEKISESLADDFSQHHQSCTCADCPFLEIGNDRRRKWFTCPYASHGETRIDSEACDHFYREAVKRMRRDNG